MAIAIPPPLADRELGVHAVHQFKPEECQKFIDLHKDPKNIHKQGKINQENSQVVKLEKRDVDVWVIHEDNHQIDEMLILMAMQANLHFGFQVTGLLERPQLLRYKSPSKGYDWHLDIGKGDAGNRKISMSVTLNDDFDGGELAFFITGEFTVPPTAGQAIAFPSFMPHAVTPVTKGERWSLVSWFSGEAFR